MNIAVTLFLRQAPIFSGRSDERAGAGFGAGLHPTDRFAQYRLIAGLRRRGDNNLPWQVINLTDFGKSVRLPLFSPVVLPHEFLRILLPGGTLSVNHTFPPITDPSPTVIRPKIVAPA